MLYVKQSFGYADVTTEIRKDNVFAHCAQCGCEVGVDIAKMYSSLDNATLANTEVICKECTPYFKKHASDKVKITADGLKLLCETLSEVGYGDQIMGLWDKYEIDSIDELPFDAYEDFYHALTAVAAGEVHYDV